VDGKETLGSPEVRDRLIRLFRYGQVGRCVSSVTHDINNLLGAIQAYAELVEMDEALSSESRRMLGQAGEAARNCGALIRSLTAVARKERPDVDFVDLAPLVDAAVALKQYDLQMARVHVERVADDEIPLLAADRPHLAMATIYLLMNALEAVEGTDDRRVAVRVRNGDGAARIEVWDSGPPVPEGDRERIFEPFYTTKHGEHVGLGLTIARETARRHRGDVTYDPAQGFVLRLPHDTGLSPMGNAGA